MTVHFGPQEVCFQGRCGDLQGPMDRFVHTVRQLCGWLCRPEDGTVASVDLSWKTSLASVGFELPRASAGHIALDLHPPASAGLRPASAEGEKTTFEFFENEALFETRYMGLSYARSKCLWAPSHRNAWRQTRETTWSAILACWYPAHPPPCFGCASEVSSMSVGVSWEASGEPLRCSFEAC